MKYIFIAILACIALASEPTLRQTGVTCAAINDFYETPAGQTGSKPCGLSRNGSITSLCQDDGTWAAEDDSACTLRLGPGSVAIIQSQSVGSVDDFDVLILDVIDQGTQILFTDNSLKQDQTFRANEGILTWTVERTYYPGEIVLINQNANHISPKGSFNLATKDSIIAYIIYNNQNVFLFCLYTNSDGWTKSPAKDDSNSCYEPTSLTPYNAALTVYSIAVNTYYGPTTGTKTQLLAAIANKDNWMPSAIGYLVIGNTDFFVVNSEVSAISCPTDAEWTAVAAGEYRAVPCTGLSGVRVRSCSAQGTWGEILDYCGATAINCEVQDTFPATPANTVYTTTCPSPLTGTVTRKCNWNGKWLPADATGCDGSHFAGGAAFVQTKFTSTAKIGIVTLVALPVGTTIYITDGAYTQKKEFLLRETIVSYTITDTPLPAGSVLTFENSAAFLTANPNWQRIGSAFTLSTSGDNLFIFIGSPYVPYFVYGMSYQVEWLTSGSVSDSSSYLPTELEYYNRVATQIAYSNTSRLYNGSKVGDKITILQNLKSGSWINNSDSAAVVEGPFTVTGAENDFICLATGTLPQSNMGETYEDSCTSGTGSTLYKCTFEYPNCRWVLESTTCETPSAVTVSYSQTNQLSFIKNAAVTPVVPTVTGGIVLSFSISPSLPFGLSLNSQTGVISGTPYIASPLSTYTLTYVSAAGSATISLTVSVNVAYCQASGEWAQTEVGSSAQAPCADLVNYSGAMTRPCVSENTWGDINNQCVPNQPTNLSYPEGSYSISVNDAFSITPTVTGIVSSWTVDPALPSGLILNVSTGVISGAPLTGSDQVTYTITASNQSGSTTFLLVLSVSSTICAADGSWPITNSGSEATIACAAGYEGEQKRACVQNGLFAEWGAITGTCTYKVPVISYSQITYAFVVNVPITPLVPTVENIVTLWLVTPTLPSGLVLDTTTGIISGTPTVLTASASYTVTGSNGVNQGYAIFTLQVVNAACAENDGWPNTQLGQSASKECSNVVDYTGSMTRLCNAYAQWEAVVDNCRMIAPADVLYGTNNQIIVPVSAAMTPIVPTYTHIATSWTASILPAGLVIDPSTGALSGTPTVVSATTPYTINVANTHSSTPVTIYITVQQSVCAASDGYAATQIGLTATKDCADTVNYEGNMSKQCMTGSVWGPEVDNCIPRAPANIIYPTNNEIVIAKGDEANIIPTFSYLVTSVTTVTALPSGLALNPSTGAITGTASVSTVRTPFTITFSNSHKSTPVTVYITVNTLYCAANGEWPQTERGNIATLSCTDSNYEGSRTRTCTNTNPPSFLDPVSTCQMKAPVFTYGTTSFTYYKKYSVALTPTVSNVATTWTVSPAFSAGLSINAQTGVISGIPTETKALTAYVITAANSDKSSSVTISITIEARFCNAQNDLPQTEAGETATKSCGASTSYGGIETYLCGVTETPSFTLQSNTCYKLAPTVTYPSNSISGTKLSVLSPVTPTTSGIIETVTVSPSLPSGLSIDTTTGRISGTPSVIASGSYAITFANSDRNTVINMSISITALYCAATGDWPSTERGVEATINCGSADEYTGNQKRFCQIVNPATWGTVTRNCVMVAPHSISFINTNTEIKQMQTIQDIYPTYLGIVESVSIEPELPAGLTFNAVTGRISGTPTVYTSSTVYTFTFRNTNAAATATLSLTVVKQACDADSVFAETPITITAYGTCPSGTTGTQTRNCVLTNNVATWENAISYCVAYSGTTEQPVRGYQFVHWSITMNVPVSSYDTKARHDVRYAYSEILSSQGIQLSDIILENIVDPDSVSSFYEGSTSKLTFRVNAPVDKKTAIMSDVETKTNDGTYTSTLKQRNTLFASTGATFDATSVSSVDAPVLTTTEIIIIVVVVVVVIIIIIVVVIIVVKKNRQPKRPKLQPGSNATSKTAPKKVKTTKKNGKQYNKDSMI